MILRQCDEFGNLTMGRGLTQPQAGANPVLDEQGQFRPRHAADDYAGIAKRMRGRWIPKREEN